MINRSLVWTVWQLKSNCRTSCPGDCSCLSCGSGTAACPRAGLPSWATVVAAGEPPARSRGVRTEWSSADDHRIFHGIHRRRAQVGVGNFPMLCLRISFSPTDFGLARRQRRLEFGLARCGVVEDLVDEHLAPRRGGGHRLGNRRDDGLRPSSETCRDSMSAAGIHRLFDDKSVDLLLNPLSQKFWQDFFHLAVLIKTRATISKPAGAAGARPSTLASLGLLRLFLGHRCRGSSLAPAALAMPPPPISLQNAAAPRDPAPLALASARSTSAARALARKDSRSSLSSSRARPRPPRAPAAPRFPCSSRRGLAFPRPIARAPLALRPPVALSCSAAAREACVSACAFFSAFAVPTPCFRPGALVPTRRTSDTGTIAEHRAQEPQYHHRPPRQCPIFHEEE